METFQERVKLEMKRKGLIVKELAAAANLSMRTVEKYLGAQGSLPIADNAVRIARALGVTVEYLVTGQTESRAVLPPDIRHVVEKLEVLDQGDRRAVEALIDSLSVRYLSDSTARDNLTG